MNTTLLISGLNASPGTYRKIVIRLMPVLFICYILAYLDRVNVGFAKLAMTGEPWFSEAVFAFGSGIFFIGYFVFEVPANIIMHRIGARIWLTRIMITWGCLSALCAMSDSAAMFYIFRFLLGIAEAGFFPGVILYLTYWFPMQYRARIVALFMTAVAVAGIIGSPLSGLILMYTDEWENLSSWQWLFILEGVPSVLVGLLLPFLLKNDPSQVSWLSMVEKDAIQRDMNKDEVIKSQAAGTPISLIDTFRNRKVWICTLIYLGITIGLYGVSFWLPQLIEDTLTDIPFRIGMYAAVPWLIAAVGMNVFGRHSDRTGERRWHISLAAVGSGIFFALTGIYLFSLPPYVVFLFMILATTGMMCAVSSFWTLPTSLLSGTAAAAGIALINSVGNLGGFISPSVFAWCKEEFSTGFGLVVVGLCIAFSGFLIWKIWRSPEQAEN